MRYFPAILSLIVLLILTENQISAQGTDSRQIKTGSSKMFVGINIDPVTTRISNDFTSPGLKVKGGGSMNVTIDGGYFFSEFAGISIGAGYSSYATTLNLDSASYKFSATDDENEQYEMRILGKTISENQKISFLSIPATLILRYSTSEKLGFYLKPGLKFSIPLSKNYDGSGTFTYDAYYAAYPILLHGLDEFGFPANYRTEVSDDLELKSFSMAMTLSAGASYSVNEKIGILFGVTFNRSLGNISAYTKDPGFRLSSVADELKSFMAGSNKAGLQAFGLNIGLRYFLK